MTVDRGLREELIRERRFEELLELQTRAIGDEPTDPELHRELAWVLAALGRIPDAAEAQREACRLRPDDSRYEQTLAGYEAQLESRADTDAPPSDAAEVFGRVHAVNHWQGSESVSGPGSSLAATAAVRSALPFLLRGLGATTMLDAPCGDFGWMSHAELGALHYIGVDVVPELIDIARSRAGAHQEFRIADISRDPLPRADLVLCRDCLVHLTEESAFAAIANLKRSGSRYLLATTFYALRENRRGSTGGWRPLNMQRPPFSFGSPTILIPERGFDLDIPHSDKSLGLWDIALLPDRPA
jgi:hypothetical protein